MGSRKLGNGDVYIFILLVMMICWGVLDDYFTANGCTAKDLQEILISIEKREK